MLCTASLPLGFVAPRVVTPRPSARQDLNSMEQVRRIMRPTDVPDTGAPGGGRRWPDTRAEEGVGHGGMRDEGEGGQGVSM